MKYMHNFSFLNSSALSTFYLVLSILIEDLGVFLKELSESVSNVLLLFLNCFCLFRDFINNTVSNVCNSIISFIDAIISNVTSIVNTTMFLAQKCGEMFKLVGHSLILIINMIPRTLYLMYLGSINLIIVTRDAAITSSCQLYHRVMSMSVEMIIGIITTILFTGLSVRIVSRFIRERNITWSWCLHSIISLVCCVYLCIITSLVKCLRVTVRLMEMMLSNLRVPMFAHAGDSEDEAEEDRENLVADVEDSDEEENERMVSRRRNYQLLLERAKQRKGKTEATRLLFFSHTFLSFFLLILLSS